MAAPNMAAITASLERSFQSFSLNPRPPDEDYDRLLPTNPSDDAILELNSHVAMPYHWEQCLDLETGEIYYINWRNGMRSKEDPRLTKTGYDDDEGGLYSSSSDESCYDSEESSSESPPSSREEEERCCSMRAGKDQVLVVGGCKSCLMYFMVPRRVEDCPKCCGRLIHFDRSSEGDGESSP